MPRKLILLFSVIILLIATLMPGSGATGLPYVDKVAHFGLFFFAAWNVLHCFKHKPPFLFLFTLLLLLAPLTEIAQLYIPLRGFEYLDILADLLGIWVAYALYVPRWARLYTIIAK